MKRALLVMSHTWLSLDRIVHGGHQLVPVEVHLQGLVEKHIPPEDRAGFVFHATDIWSNGKYFKDRQRWPLERRLPILEALADIPASFGLPIVLGVSRKDYVKSILGPQPEKVLDFV